MKTILSIIAGLFLALSSLATDVNYSYYFYAVNGASSSCYVDGQWALTGNQIACHNGSQISAQYAYGCVPTTYATIGYLYVYDETVTPRKEVMEVELKMYYGVEWDQWNISCVGNWIGYNVVSEYAPCK